MPQYPVKSVCPVVGFGPPPGGGGITQDEADARYVQIVDAFTQVLADARYVQLANAFTQALADLRYLMLTGGTLTGNLIGTNETMTSMVTTNFILNGTIIDPNAPWPTP
jgi:hypothetical protein